MKRQPIHKRVNQIIEDRRAQLKKEIEEWEDKLRGTEEFWGYNGPYMQQAAALERRQKELDELEEYARQLGKYIPFKEVSVSVLFCRDCGNLILSSHSPTGQWSECPSCKHMIYCENPTRKTFRIEEGGQEWLEAFKENEWDKAYYGGGAEE